MTSTRTGTSDSSSLDPLWGSGSSSARHREVVRTLETTNEVLRKELLAVEVSWADEHGSLLVMLEAKDQQIWTLAQQLSDAAAAAPAPHQPRPPRIGRRERPKMVPVFPLREAGAMVLTPAKRTKQTRPAPPPPKPAGGPKPAWGEGHAGGHKMGGAPPVAAKSQMQTLPPGMGLGDLAKAAKAAKGGAPPKGGKGSKGSNQGAAGAAKRKPISPASKAKAAKAQQQQKGGAHAQAHA